MFSRLIAWGKRLLGRQTSATGCPCDKCGKFATAFIYDVSRKTITKERRFCDQCAIHHLWIPNPTPSAPIHKAPTPQLTVRMEMDRLICFSASTEHYIILREADGPRRLALTTGYFEATALWWLLRGEPSPRPLTHDAWLNSVISLDARVESACIHDHCDEAYIAELRLLRGEVTVSVDVRPSDALLIVLRAGVPLYITEGLLAQCAVSEPEPA